MSHKPWHQPTQPDDTPRQSLLSCARKYRWATIVAANGERDRLALENPTRQYNSYYCAFCKGYHVGREPLEGMEQSA